MAANPIPIAERRVAFVWTGTNGQDIATALNAILSWGEFEVTAETETHLTLTGNAGYGREPHMVDMGGAYVLNGGNWMYCLDASLYALLYRPA